MNKRYLVLGIVLLAVEIEMSAVSRADVPEEVILLQIKFGEVLAGIEKKPNVSSAYLAQISEACRPYLEGERITDSQYLLVVDRRSQIILVGFYDATNQGIVPIGWDFVSTGKPQPANRAKGTQEHFVTPLGAFRYVCYDDDAMESRAYRSQGTPDVKGWRGYGLKGARVWDFGWQETIDRRGEKRAIRLQLHETDPNSGIPFLGRAMSMGCIRIRHELNWFLDHYGLIDRDCETESHRDQLAWALAPDREPVILAGEYLIVVETAQ